jgi:4'-phosphopantetheinyl transferase
MEDMFTFDQLEQTPEMAPVVSWHPPPEAPVLGKDEVHVWRANLDFEPSRIQSLRQLLPPDEQARADRFFFAKDREHFIAAHGLLRVILAFHLQMEPERLHFCYSPYGKPALTSILGRNGLNFNMAHSHGLALYGFARGRKIGIDLEYIYNDIVCEDIAERFFSPVEKAVLRTLPPEVKHEAFFNCWTRKEAYVKARGEGLSFPLDQFDVTLAPGEPAKLLNVEEEPGETFRWSLRELELGPKYAAALAVEGHGWQLKLWQWPKTR